MAGWFRNRVNLTRDVDPDPDWVWGLPGMTSRKLTTVFIYTTITLPSPTIAIFATTGSIDKTHQSTPHVASSDHTDPHIVTKTQFTEAPATNTLASTTQISPESQGEIKFAQTPLEYDLYGCFNDTYDRHSTREGHVVLGTGYKSAANDIMDIYTCAFYCVGTDYMGVTKGRKCFCGNTLLEEGNRVRKWHCDIPCHGQHDPKISCGGNETVLVYKYTGNLHSPTPMSTWTPRFPSEADITARVGVIAACAVVVFVLVALLHV